MLDDRLQVTVSNRFSVDGEQRNRGIELNVFGAPAQGVRILGGGTLFDAKITKASDNEGNEPYGVPKRQVNLGAEWDVPATPGLTLSGRVLYTSSVYINNANTYFIPSWTRWDAGVRYATRIVGKPVLFRANIENLLGKDYWIANQVENWLSISTPRSWIWLH